MRRFLLGTIAALSLAFVPGVHAQDVQNLAVWDADTASAPANVVLDEDGSGSETTRWTFALVDANRADCALDEGNFVRCSSGYSVSAAVGSHTATVVARKKGASSVARTVQFVVCPASGGTDSRCPGSTTPPPPDQDGDGVPDADDQCPAVPGPASNGGCPVEEPPPPPPPPANDCTKVLAAGGDFVAFKNGLVSGDVGCLRAGVYTASSCAVSWSLDANPRATIRSYPGEVAELRFQFNLAGDNLTAAYLRVARIPASCGGDMSGFTAQGANDEFLYNEVIGDGQVAIGSAGDVSRHGFLTNTAASNTIIHGNYVYGVGSECELDHGVYFQRSGRITRNVFEDVVCGYGIHLYSSPSNVVVAGNTVDGSRVRAGILVNCSSNCRVVNNIFTNNGLGASAGGSTAGITYRACSSGCVVDWNISWNNRGGPVGDSLASQATNTFNVDPLYVDSAFHVSMLSPAWDNARADHAYWPDRDGVTETIASLGAYR